MGPRIIFIYALLFLASCSKKQWDDEVLKLDLPDASQLNALHFLPDGKLSVFGGKRFERSDFYSSADNGSSWQVFHHPPDGNKGIYAGNLVGNKMWAAGFDGKIFLQNDQDSAWTYRQTNYFFYTFTGIAQQHNTALVVGNKSYNDGLIMRLDTTGQILQIDSFPFAINDVIFADHSHAFAVGYGAVLKSSDTGKTWRQLDIPDDNYMGIACKSIDDIWVVGYEGTIVHIRNQGNDFNKIRNGQNPFGKKERYRDIAFKGDFGVIVGDKGLVQTSKDGGNSWQARKALTKHELRAVAIAPFGDFFVTVGVLGSAFKVNY